LNYKESQKAYTDQGRPEGFSLRIVAEKIAETTN
jgi:hypothetical protein